MGLRKLDGHIKKNEIRPIAITLNRTIPNWSSLYVKSVMLKLLKENMLYTYRMWVQEMYVLLMLI